MSNVNAAGKTNGIIDPTADRPSDNIQLTFALLQLKQAKACQDKAKDCMKEIEEIQKEQKTTSEMIALARKDVGFFLEMPNGKKRKDTETIGIWDSVKEFCNKNNLPFKMDKDRCTTKDMAEFNLKSLMNYQEQIGAKTQVIMVNLNDYVGQNNSYSTGSKTIISDATDTLKTLMR